MDNITTDEMDETTNVATTGLNLLNIGSGVSDDDFSISLAILIQT